MIPIPKFQTLLVYLIIAGFVTYVIIKFLPYIIPAIKQMKGGKTRKHGRNNNKKCSK